MTKRLPPTPATSPLQEYAERFDELCTSYAQGEGFRRYLEIGGWVRAREGSS